MYCICGPVSWLTESGILIIAIDSCYTYRSLSDYVHS
jgi:hypothetical protein